MMLHTLAHSFLQPQLISRPKAPVAPVLSRGPRVSIAPRSLHHRVHCRAHQQPAPAPKPQAEPASPAAAPAPSKALRRAATAAAGAATAAMLELLCHPGAALAAQSPEELHSQYLISVGVGMTCTLLTLLAMSRFVMSFFPRLELKARRRHLPWAVFTVCDPLLRPLQRGLFKMEPGDLDYGAVALLASVSAVLQCCVGDDGLLLEKVPDLGLLQYMQYLVFFQHAVLLPSWTLVVLRFFCFI